MLEFDLASTTQSLGVIQPRLQGAFAASCAHRLIGGYQLFVRRSARGEVRLLENVVGKAWDYLLGQPWSSSEMNADLKSCLALIPSEDGQAWIDEQAYADDAASAAAYLIRNLLGGGPKEAAWAAQRAFNAVEYYVRMNFSQKTDSQVLSHPIVQGELGRQLADIGVLLKATDESEAIARLRKETRPRAASWPNPD